VSIRATPRVDRQVVKDAATLKALRSPDRADEAAAFVILILSRFPRLRRFIILTELQGDVAIQSTTDPVWSMKQWAYYDELTNELKPAGFKGEHTAEPVHRARASGGVQDHRCLVSGDSSPMHWRWAAVPDAFSIFTCTSP
jgi:hypothetical protein